MLEDREKWEARYKDGSGKGQQPDSLLASNTDLLDGGLALDLACGKGRHSIFLAKRGYAVVAIDISLEATKTLHAKARDRSLAVFPIVADLDNFPLPSERFDLVAVFYFYEKSLIPSISDCLNPGGLLFYSTFNERHTSIKPGFNPDYLVPVGALAREFKDLRIIHSDDESGEAQNVSRIIAVRK